MLDQAIASGFSDARDILFGRLEPALTGDSEEAVCQEEKRQYTLYLTEDSGSIDHLPAAESLDRPMSMGVSAGVATGILVDTDGLLRGAYGDQATILYSEVLSPDLVAYLDQVVGIVSWSGGMLSHTAIVAREKGIPVVVKFPLGRDGVILGKMVRIDGASGVVTRI